MEEFVIAIPTFNRVEGCLKKSLTFLKRQHIPCEKIYLFVHSEDQKKLYEEGLPADYYGTIVSTNLQDGLAGQRNFIVDYFPQDANVVSMDDDVTQIYGCGFGKLFERYDLLDVIKKGFELCKANSFTLWGLYPVSNYYFMNKQFEYTKDLRFIVGAFMGFINKKRKANPELKIRQDYDLSVQAFLQDGGLIRFNRISVKYGIYTKKGGIAQSQKDRQVQLALETEILINSYPELVKRNKRRENEILLRTKYKK